MKGGIARIGPGGVSVETRLLLNRYASSGEFAQRRQKRVRGLPCGEGTFAPSAIKITGSFLNASQV
jgi:hypothetical protein